MSTVTEHLGRQNDLLARKLVGEAIIVLNIHTAPHRVHSHKMFGKGATMIERIEVAWLVTMHWMHSFERVLSSDQLCLISE